MLPVLEGLGIDPGIRQRGEVMSLARLLDRVWIRITSSSGTEVRG